MRVRGRLSLRFALRVLLAYTKLVEHVTVGVQSDARCVPHLTRDLNDRDASLDQ